MQAVYDISTGTAVPDQRPRRSKTSCKVRKGARQHPLRAQVEQLLRKGLKQKEVAERTGVTEQTVRMWRAELGLVDRRRIEGPDDRLALGLSLLRDGKTAPKGFRREVSCGRRSSSSLGQPA